MVITLIYMFIHCNTLCICKTAEAAPLKNEVARTVVKHVYVPTSSVIPGLKIRCLVYTENS